jgi:hypothetical protein
MSRSKRKKPFFRYCGHSDKQDKRFANRKFRKAEKRNLNVGVEPPSHKREVSNIYYFSSDGKHYVESPNPEWMRK